MIKKIVIFIILTTTILFSFCGCWDYKNINRLTIVAGLAVDKDGDDYVLSFEAIDKSQSTDENPFKSLLIQSHGQTISEAICAAEKQLIKKLYFGNMKLLVLSGDIVSNEGIKNIMEEIIRLPQMRETLYTVVSKEDTAAALIKPDEESKKVLSFEIKDNIEKNHGLSHFIQDMSAYRIYEKLMLPGSNLTLPAFNMDEQSREPADDGLAVLRHDRLAAYIDREDAKYYFLVMNDIGNDVFTFGEDKTLLTLKNVSTKRRFDYSGDKLILNIDCKVNSSLGRQISDGVSIEKLEQEASLALVEAIKRVADKTQKEICCDVFDFGILIYQNDNELWNKIQNNWDQTLENAEIRINAEVKITDTGFLKS